MADIDLTQAEADALIAMEKHRVEDQIWHYPSLGGSITIPLISADKTERFLLDIWRSQVDLTRGRYQNRARRVLLLGRLDFGGRPHGNPDGSQVPCPHIHIYREGYGDKWASPVPPDVFSNLGDLWQTLEDFMRYCNITRPPRIQAGL